MSVRVRFAPSPSGYLHVGGARTALFNYLFARRHGGAFVLRIEDTDLARSNDESVAAILESLRWLGLTWDEGPGVEGPHGPYFQGQRGEYYSRHAAELRARGRAYPCYCTPDELEQRRAAQLARSEAPRYDGRCRALDDAGRARLEAEGRKAALRFAKNEDGGLAWEDGVRGAVSFQNDVLDDFVLLRSDGLPTYNFACVVDDHEMEISHVIRGDDHISNTPRQLLLYRAFGWAAPHFAHVPMILGGDGSRLSKRHGATSVASYAELGYLPEAMVNFLALLGWSPGDNRELFALSELETLFGLDRCGSSPAVFNLEKLEWMNARHLKRLSEDDRVRRVEDFMAARGHDLSGRSPEWRAGLVRAIGDRLKTLKDVEFYGAFALRESLETDPQAWAELCERPGVGPRLAALAGRLASDPDFTLESLERETRGLAAEFGIKAGELMSAARVALTGRRVAPGLFEVMWLLGKDRTLERLRDAASRWQQVQTSRV
ncbi:MAG: glutamate--tRNA ligase [Candidatus Eisenbacteria bacterium]|nr:glutamate--tRNA ligase [Candidatus Eisenbacteria bacterium]